MDYAKESMKLHREKNGKLEIKSKVAINSKDDLSIAYTPGVAAPCLAIRDNYQESFTLTNRGNMIAVVTDGTAVLGLGDIGPEAGMPVMEGKCILFKNFGNVDAFPICIRSKDVDEIVRNIYLISGSFGGINLEDISAPRCFEIERKLKEICDIPIFHDDQHGTAIVAAAGMINALKLADKKISEIKVVINGAGSAGTAIAYFIMSLGVKNVIVCDSKGSIYDGADNLNSAKQELAKRTNPERIKGGLKEAMKGADVFIGVSVKDVVTADMVNSMADKPILFPCANPDPEIAYSEIKKTKAFIVGTGRSDYPNQINNVLAFPGIFRGTLDAGAKDITEEMKKAAAYAISESVPKEELSIDNIIPKAFDENVHKNVAAAVKAAWKK